MRKLLLLLLLLSPLSTTAQENASAPTHADIAYGPHERNRLDAWIPPEADDHYRFPVLVFFHGGGFISGDKSMFDPSPFLDRGIACVSANYRFANRSNFLSDAPFVDTARAVQFVRTMSDEWNLDPGRIALSGESAGATMAMWLGMHEDMADPNSDDPILRESTRATAVIALDGPTNLMPDWIIENIGGAAQVHGAIMMMFGKRIDEVLTPDIRELIATVSPWEFASADDPPMFLVYTDEMKEVPLPENASPWTVVHHPYFGKALKEKRDSVGLETIFQFGVNRPGRSDPISWLQTKFGMLD